jgi:hypothetical protein
VTQQKCRTNWGQTLPDFRRSISEMRIAAEPATAARNISRRIRSQKNTSPIAQDRSIRAVVLIEKALSLILQSENRSTWRIVATWPSSEIRPHPKEVPMKSVALLIAAASFAIATTRTNAQTTTPPADSATPRVIVPPSPITPDWPSYEGTVDGSWAHGRADIIRALGENDLNSSAAAINWEAASRAATENWAYQVRTKNRIRDEYVARERAQHPALSPDQQLEVTHLRDPKRLSASQISAAGVIRWPSALRSAEFDDARSRLDSLFAERAQGCSTSADEITREVDAVAIEMTKAVEQSNSDLPVMARVDAKKFLGGLRLEARQRLEAAGTAQVATIDKR